MKIFVAVLSISLLGVVGVVNSQSFYRFSGGRDAIVSMGTGTSTYFGDLKDPGEYMDAKPSLNIGLQHFLTPRISARTEITWFQLRGDDSDANEEGRVVRNLSFRSDNFELNIVGIINALPNGTKFYQRPQFNPYGFVGIGLLYFNPKAQVPSTDWNGTELQKAGEYIALQPLQTEGVDYSRIGIVIPFGAGIKYKANPFINISLEGGYRLTFTDYLDDVSTTYQLHNSVEDPLVQAMADRRHELSLPPLGLELNHIRGNSSNNDGYFLFNLKLEYYLPPNVLSFKKKRRNQRPFKNIQRRRR
ncbi:outer membrane beta-barrel protein [Fulvivirga sp. 29W222]|uniref:Outer membrane beta-barrel protein n=1 Tax=Fulvivirga marina TaxID=2494733 RepID=A0A937FSZ4_9BACT|nr:outer membrane beta-barrel protein [Fulvivirga marina]MBL6444779.1 outer membrane beta-barrel protein [Fulvivirga marina]